MVQFATNSTVSFLRPLRPRLLLLCRRSSASSSHNIALVLPNQKRLVNSLPKPLRLPSLSRWTFPPLRLRTLEATRVVVMSARSLPSTSLRSFVDVVGLRDISLPSAVHQHRCRVLPTRLLLLEPGQKTRSPSRSGSPYWRCPVFCCCGGATEFRPIPCNSVACRIHHFSRSPVESYSIRRNRMWSAHSHACLARHWSKQQLCSLRRSL